MSVAVPKGNRQAILIYGTRADFGGDAECRRRRPARRRDRRGARRWPPASRCVPVLFSAKADAPLAGALADVTGKPVDPEAQGPLDVRPDVDPGAGPEQRQRLVAHRRPPGGRRHRGVPVHDRDRRAQGAAGPGRLDGPEGPGAPQAGLQGGDRGLPPLEPAGRRLGRRRRDPREARTRRSSP